MCLSCESSFDGTSSFLTFISTTTYRQKFFHISTNIQMLCGLNAKKKKNHCLVSNVENFVAKIQSVNYSLFCSVYFGHGSQSYYMMMKFVVFLFLFNPFPNKPWFLCVCSKSLLKTLWEKEKLLVMSTFSFSHIVFYPFIFCHFYQL